MSQIPNVNFMRFSKATIPISIVLVVISLLSIGIKGFNLGIDFTGGTLVERQLGRATTTDELRDVLSGPELADLDLAGAVIQLLDDPRDVLVRTPELTTAEINRVDAQLAATFGDVELRRTEFVGPVIGAELVRKALFALGISALLVLAYVWFRFELKFAVVAIAAVLHDVLLVLGFVSLVGNEVNSAFVAAVLTVLGYSINDTIVIFDRIREHIHVRQQKPSAALVNLSLNETLSRTINTSVTTLLVIMTLFLFGGTTIRDFVLALLVGVAVGTYSSVMVAAPTWYLWHSRDGGPRRRMDTAPVR